MITPEHSQRAIFSDNKLLAMEEFLIIGNALRRLLKAPHAAEQ